MLRRITDFQMIDCPRALTICADDADRVRLLVARLLAGGRELFITGRQVLDFAASGAKRQILLRLKAHHSTLDCQKTDLRRLVCHDEGVRAIGPKATAVASSPITNVALGRT